MKITKYEKIVGYDDIHDYHTVKEVVENAGYAEAKVLSYVVVGDYEDEKDAQNALQALLNDIEPTVGENGYPAYKATYYCLDDGTFAKDNATRFYYGDSIWADVKEVVCAGEVLYREYSEYSDEEPTGDFGSLKREIVSGEILAGDKTAEEQFGEGVNVMRIVVK